MEKYEKRIKYLDYLEYGSKMRNGGFLRTEKAGDSCRVQISVKGLYPTDTLSTDILLCKGAEKQKVDSMMLHYGKGDYTAVWNTRNLAGTGMAYADWDGIEIVVSEQRKLVCVWQMSTHQEERIGSEPERQSAAISFFVADEMPKESEQEEEVHTVQEVCEEQERIEETVIASAEIKVESRKEEEQNNRQRSPFADLYEDKWTQLEQYYKRIRPFGDKRSYLSITPRDFIVLGGKYQKLVSNSFLLHGYYNYGHVILGRLEDGDGYQYYLGVPGIYHEREKQVAKMFGFNGFEGAVSPCSEGGFGYYMTAVEI